MNTVQYLYFKDKHWELAMFNIKEAIMISEFHLLKRDSWGTTKGSYKQFSNYTRVGFLHAFPSFLFLISTLQLWLLKLFLSLLWTCYTTNKYCFRTNCFSAWKFPLVFNLWKSVKIGEDVLKLRFWMGIV